MKGNKDDWKWTREENHKIGKNGARKDKEKERDLNWNIVHIGWLRDMERWRQNWVMERVKKETTHYWNDDRAIKKQK